MLRSWRRGMPFLHEGTRSSDKTVNWSTSLRAADAAGDQIAQRRRAAARRRPASPSLSASTWRPPAEDFLPEEPSIGRRPCDSSTTVYCVCTPADPLEPLAADDDEVAAVAHANKSGLALTRLEIEAARASARQVTRSLDKSPARSPKRWKPARPWRNPSDSATAQTDHPHVVRTRDAEVLTPRAMWRIEPTAALATHSRSTSNVSDGVSRPASPDAVKPNLPRDARASTPVLARAALLRSLDRVDRLTHAEQSALGCVEPAVAEPSTAARRDASVQWSSDTCHGTNTVEVQTHEPQIAVDTHSTAFHDAIVFRAALDTVVAAAKELRHVDELQRGPIQPSVADVRHVTRSPSRAASLSWAEDEPGSPIARTAQDFSRDVTRGTVAQEPTPLAEDPTPPADELTLVLSPVAPRHGGTPGHGRSTDRLGMGLERVQPTQLDLAHGGNGSGMPSAPPLHEIAHRSARRDGVLQTHAPTEASAAAVAQQHDALRAFYKLRHEFESTRQLHRAHRLAATASLATKPLAV